MNKKEKNADPQLKSSKNIWASHLAINLDFKLLLLLCFGGLFLSITDGSNRRYNSWVLLSLAHLTSEMTVGKNPLAFIKWSEISTWAEINQYLSQAHVIKRAISCSPYQMLIIDTQILPARDAPQDASGLIHSIFLLVRNLLVEFFMS